MSIKKRLYDLQKDIVIQMYFTDGPEFCKACEKYLWDIIHVLGEIQIEINIENSKKRGS